MNLRKLTGDFLGGISRGVQRNIINPITHPDINAAVGGVARAFIPGMRAASQIQQQSKAITQTPQFKAFQSTQVPTAVRNYANFAANMTKPVNTQQVINNVGGAVLNAPGINRIKDVPGVKPVASFLNQNIVQPNLQTAARVSLAGQGAKPYASGMKGVGQLTQDVTNIATAVPGLGQGAKLGSRLAINAAPGVASSVGQSLADGNRNIVDIAKNAALSGGATALFGEAAGGVSKLIGKVRAKAPEIPSVTLTKKVTPTKIDKNTSGAMGRLNALDGAVKPPAGTVRVYSAGKQGSKADWVFTDPDALANFKNNNAVKGEVFRFHDVRPEDLIPTNRDGIMQISKQAQDLATTGRKSVSVGVKDNAYAYDPIYERAPKVTAKSGITTEQGPISQTEIQRLMKESADKVRGRDATTERAVIEKAAKDPRVQEVLQTISRSKSGVEGNLTTAEIQSAAKNAGVKLDAGFIDRYQAGKLKPNERAVGAKVKEVTDRIFEQQKALNPKIEYRQNYVPQSYKDAESVVQDAAKRLQTKTGAAQPRAFNTYKEARAFGLNPKYQSLDQMIGANAGEASRAATNREAIVQGLKSGVFDVTPDKGWAPVTGFFDNNGNQLYAQKNVADTFNGVTQGATSGLGKVLDKTAKFSGKAQDVMLQGGLPGTNANFFVFGQGVKDTTRNIGKAILHPVQAVKQEKNLIGDFFRGKQGTVERFAKPENAAFVREMANRGLYINPETSLSNATKGALERNWDKLGNNPTFGRYMPNRMLSTAQEVYEQSAKKLGHQGALDLAAETTKAFTGQVDQILKGRNKLTSDAIASVAFAPKYRESIIKALTNVVKSVSTEAGNKAYAPSRQLLVGMIATLGAYEALNKKYSGHSMFENREGQTLSLEIPYGEKDSKGNQPVINIPFMPGFTTIPRAIFEGGKALSKGDIKGVAGQLSKGLSAPLQTAGSLYANEDYKGQPIYIDQKTADKEGVDPDSAGSSLGKVGAYVGGQFSPAWVRGAIDKAQGKPTEQALATALEAPVKFGKVINPETTAYFENKDNFYKGLNKNEKALFDKMNPAKKNINGENIRGDKLPLTSAANYGDLVANPDFAAKYQAYKRNEKNHDPLWDLDKNQLRSYMQAQVISKNDPGGDGTTVRKLYDRLPQDFFDKRSAYFADLKAKGVLGKDDPNYTPRPKMPNELQAFADSYQNLPYGTGARSKALRTAQGQAYIAYLDANKLYNNQERADLGLPPLEDSKYSSGSGGSGSSGGSGGRTATLKPISQKSTTKTATAKFSKPKALAKVKLSTATLKKTKSSSVKSKV